MWLFYLAVGLIFGYFTWFVIPLPLLGAGDAVTLGFLVWSVYLWISRRRRGGGK